MSPTTDDLEALRRCLARVARLDGRVVHTTDGPGLLDRVEVRDPRPLVASLRAQGRLTAAALREGLASGTTMMPLSRRWLGAAQRDLARILKQPEALAWIAGTPRLFRRFSAVDQAWLDDRQARLDALSNALERPGLASWFDAALELAAAARGQAHADRLADLARASVAIGRVWRARANRRLGWLIAALAEEPAGSEPEIVGRIRTAARPNRRVRRRLGELVASFVLDSDNVGCPHLDWREVASRDLIDAVRSIGESAIRTIGSTRSEAYVDRLQNVVITYGLIFDVDDVVRPLTPSEVRLAYAQRNAALNELGGLRLRLPEALTLLGREPAFRGLRRAGRWVEAGLTPGEVAAVESLGLAFEAQRLEADPATLTAYCRWMLRLVPHYQRIGVRLELSAIRFKELSGRVSARRPRAHRDLQNEELRLLAHCLVHHHHHPSAATIQGDLRHLDATLGLFQTVPDVARALVARMRTARDGLGVARYPQLAAWLGDHALLDQYLTLQELAGEEPRVSRTLLKDYEHSERVEGERRFLQSLVAPDARQKSRLASLQGSAERGSRRTRARMRRRLDDLTAAAYRAQLHRALRELLDRAFGIQPPLLDDAWLDAVRFFLTSEANGELLGVILRHAASAPGVALDHLRPECQAWLERAAEHMNVQAWLAPSERVLELDGKHFRLGVERDPLQVLRMGIPFRTCLSLQTGSNSAATVINALDVNKQVLYLRAPDNAIVARQLIAVSDRFELLGYEIYIALGDDHRDRVIEGFSSLCETIAQRCGLNMASAGTSEQLHAGFWYCDSPRAPSNSRIEAPVSAFCEALGRAVPERPPHPLVNTARGWRAMAAGDVAAAAATVANFGPHAFGICAWIHRVADDKTIVELCNRHERFADAMVRYTGRTDPIEALELTGRITWPWETSCVDEMLLWVPPSVQAALHYIKAAEASRRRSDAFDTHGLAHGTFLRPVRLLQDATAREVLRIAERVDATWRWVFAQSAHCTSCRAQAIVAWKTLAERAYVRKPEPDAVVECLRATRNPGLAEHLALHLAARFALDGSPVDPILRTSGVAPIPSVVRVLRRLSEASSDLPRGDLGAAIARHALSPNEAARNVPLAALGSLLSLLDLEALRPQDVDPAEWQPTEWELYHHRRTTNLRYQLRRRLPHDPSVSTWLIALGDVDGLSRAGLGRDAALASFVANQISPAARPDLGALREMSEDRARHLIDPSTTRSALEALPTDEAWSLEVLWHALPEDAWLDLLETRLDTASEVVERLLVRTFERRAAPALQRLTPAQLERFWPVPALRSAVSAAIAASDHNFWGRFLAWRDRIDLDKLDAEEMLTAWIAHSTENEWLTLEIETDDDAEVAARCCRDLPADRWLSVFFTLPDARAANVFLRASAATIENRRAELRNALEARPSDPHADPERTWLLQVLGSE